MPYEINVILSKRLMYSDIYLMFSSLFTDLYQVINGYILFIFPSSPDCLRCQLVRLSEVQLQLIAKFVFYNDCTYHSICIKNLSWSVVVKSENTLINRKYQNIDVFFHFPQGLIYHCCNLIE